MPIVPSPVRLGEVTFDEERVTFHSGDVIVRSFRRDVLRGVHLVNDSAAQRPLRQGLWGSAFVLGGCAGLTHGLWWSALLVGLGVWVLVHIFKSTSYLVLYVSTGSLKISLDERFDDSILLETGKRLRLLGYRGP